MRVWRLCKAKYANDAFQGQGARIHGGRWNPVGVPMVYTSSSLALASNEIFVNSDPSLLPNDLIYVAADLPEDFSCDRLEPEDLPADWRDVDHPDLQRIGAEWIASRRTLALEVPSAAVEDDWNILLNPLHPEFLQVVLGTPVAWRFNERMHRNDKP